MPGVIIENLSGKKLAVLTAGLVVCQITCFLIGGLIAPSPSNVASILAIKCIDQNEDPGKFFYSRGNGSCSKRIDNINPENIDEHTKYNIVFTFQIPLPKEGVQLDYSRWMQNLIGVLWPDVAHIPGIDMDDGLLMNMHVRLGYRNKGDPDDAWKELASSVETRQLECQRKAEQMEEGSFYICNAVPLFELGSLHHDFYLVNVRLPNTDRQNKKLPLIVDMNLAVINQNGGFTKVWVSMKTIFFPFIIAIMVWFWRRIKLLSRPPVLLEYMLMALGAMLTFLNLPLEYLTLAWDMPFMLLLGDVKQGLFYAVLLSFWLVFTGEHLMDDIERNRLKSYWRHLGAVAFGCLCLFVFDMCERGAQLRNPFYSIWTTDVGTNLALTFIIMAGLSAGLYFIFLCVMIYRVFRNISSKRAALPTMSSLRRMHYEGIIYRFKFLMLATLLCAAMTVVEFILGQVSEDQWKWEDTAPSMQYTSAFFTGVYGMWNIYIFALLCLYAPSHKRWPTQTDVQSSTNEEIEFSRLPTEPSEISSLTALAKKTTLD